MAFLVKNTIKPSASSSSRGATAVLNQDIQVTTAARTIPATTTDQIFRVKGGRVLVKRLIGTVTTTIQTQTDNMKVSSKALDAASVAIGTAVDVAANLDITAMEVGGMYCVEGDGTAALKSTAGAAILVSQTGQWIAPQGEIYLTTSATNTGAMKWDIWYQPLDSGAYVESVTTATVAI